MSAAAIIHQPIEQIFRIKYMFKDDLTGTPKANTMFGYGVDGRTAVENFLRRHPHATSAMNLDELGPGEIF